MFPIPSQQCFCITFILLIMVALFAFIYFNLRLGCQSLDMVGLSFNNLRHTTGAPGSDETPRCMICLIRIHRYDDTLTHTLCNQSMHARCLMKWHVFQAGPARCPYDRQAYQTNLSSACATELYHKLCKDLWKREDISGPCVDCRMEKVEERFGRLGHALAAMEVFLIAGAMFLEAVAGIIFAVVIIAMIVTVPAMLYYVFLWWMGPLEQAIRFMD